MKTRAPNIVLLASLPLHQRAWTHADWKAHFAEEERQLERLNDISTRYAQAAPRKS